MTGFADYERYDALGLADLVKRGKVLWFQHLPSLPLRSTLYRARLPPVLAPWFPNHPPLRI